MGYSSHAIRYCLCPAGTQASNRDTLFYRNTGTAKSPVFAAPVTNPFGLAGRLLETLTLADIDGDGDLDAFIGQYNGNTLFQRNTGTADNPVFAAAITNPFGLTQGSYFGAAPPVRRHRWRWRSGCFYSGWLWRYVVLP